MGTKLKHLLILFFSLVLISSTITSCKKLVEVDPPLTSITSSVVFSDDVSATGMVTGLYVQMANTTPVQITPAFISINTVAGLSADELSVLPGLSGPFQRAFRNELNSAQDLSGTPFTWAGLYSIANGASVAIEGLSAQKTIDLDNNSNLTSSVKKQLLGEAKFIRGICYFYLVNFFGDVPLVLKANINEESNLPRSRVSDVYTQIITDLTEAKELLSSDFLASNLITVSTERVRPTRSAAAALLARVYLYTAQYEKAITNSTEVIENSRLFGLTTLDQAFLKNSREAIWQLQPVVNSWNTSLGRYFILTGAPTSTNVNKPFYLNPDLVSSFEVGDPRKTNWINSITPAGSSTTYYYPFKYKKGATADATITSSAAMTEYMTVLRLAEQYLIRSEARLMVNNPTGAAEDLNAVRRRARNGNTTVLPDISSSLSQQQMLQAIGKERRAELFTEWGDRWFDLKRTGKIDEVMRVATPQKSGLDWKSYQSLFPLLPDDIIRNPALKQNPGYQ